MALKKRLKSIAHARSVYDIVLCVYERFRVDGDKNMRLLASAFTLVFVWTGPLSSLGRLELSFWVAGLGNDMFLQACHRRIDREIRAIFTQACTNVTRHCMLISRFPNCA